ncbi:MAG: DUF4405 domain-containing protein [Oscillospiraceae bacterium]
MKIFKPILDFIMIIDFVLLQSTKFTGGNLHEILGIALAIILFIHIAVNMKQTVRMFQNFGKLKLKAKMSLIIEVILITAFAICIISGLLISKYLLHMPAFSYSFSLIHSWAGIISFIIALIHLGFHLSPLFAKINQVYDNKKIPVAAESVTYFCLALLLSVYALRDVIYSEKDTIPTIDNSYTDSKVLDSLPQSESRLNDSSVYSSDSSEFSDSSENTDDYSSEEYSDSQMSESETDDSKNDEQLSQESQSEPVESLEDYLSKLNCTGCHKHCPLTAPQCGRGVNQQAEAVSEYNTENNTNETYN